MSIASPRVALALSGGVDSAVALHLLVGSGYRVHAFFMDTAFFSKDAHLKAEAVAQRFGVPFSRVDVTHFFEKTVVRSFEREYSLGRTPNPCALCNREVKFGFFFREIVAKYGVFDFFSTGHYAQIQAGESGVRLLRGADPKKDQSYFLSRLPPSLLPKLLFPLGAFTKEKVWKIAASLGMASDFPGESQEICFVPGDAYYPFLVARGLVARPCRVETASGEVLGVFPKGIEGVTVGQRRGLGISSERRLFVQRLYPEENRIVLAPREDLFSTQLVAGQWAPLVSSSEWNQYQEEELLVQVRSRTPPHPARVFLREMEGDCKLFVAFSQPVFAITPGQVAVVYRHDQVCGAGIIERSGHAT
ncbi:MAG TPA: tRNA 2-thiouridine(34) synthase MnmA [Thermotogota bacterium]|nr:tRNA 2-thiouridine(34) synthase MnmA [Thermotogota bacterium]